MFTLTGESHNQKLPSVAQTGANKMPQVQLSTLNTNPVVFKSGATSLEGNLISIEVKRPRSKVYDTVAIPLSKVLQYAEGDADVGFVVHTPINAEDGGDFYEGELDSIPDENGYVTLTDANGTEVKILESLIGSITVVETEEEEEAPKAKSKAKAAPAKKAKKVADVEEDEEEEDEEEEAPKAKSKAKAAPAKKAKKVVDEDEDDEDFDDEDFDDEDEEDEAPKAKSKSKAKAAPAKKAKKVVDEDEDEDDDEDFEFDDEDE